MNLFNNTSILSTEAERELFKTFFRELSTETNERIIDLFNLEVDEFNSGSPFFLYLAAVTANMELRDLDEKELLKDRRSLLDYVVFLKNDKLCHIDDLTLSEVEVLVYRYIFGKINDAKNRTPSVVNYDKEWIIYKDHNSLRILKTQTNFLIKSIIKGDISDNFDK